MRETGCAYDTSGGTDGAVDAVGGCHGTADWRNVGIAPFAPTTTGRVHVLGMALPAWWSWGVRDTTYRGRAGGHRLVVSDGGFFRISTESECTGSVAEPGRFGGVV